VPENSDRDKSPRQGSTGRKIRRKDPWAVKTAGKQAFLRVTPVDPFTEEPLYQHLPDIVTGSQAPSDIRKKWLYATLGKTLYQAVTIFLEDQ